MHIVGTSIFINGKVDTQELYMTCLRQLIFYDGRNINPSDIPLATTTKETMEHYLLDLNSDHGLQSVLGVWWKEDGSPISSEEAKGAWDTSCSDLACTEHQVEPFQVLVGFASSLHYTDSRGWNAGDLHSGMIYNIGAYLDCLKVPWRWQEGFRKDIHEGYGDLGNLPSLINEIHVALANPGQFMAQQMLRALGLIQDNGS